MFNIYKLGVYAEPELPSFSGLFHMFIEKNQTNTLNLYTLNLLGFPWEFKNSVETGLFFLNCK